MSGMEEYYRTKADVAEARAAASGTALEKALAELGDAAAVARAELDPTEHTRIMADVDKARSQAQALVEVARIKHNTIRLLIGAALVVWIAAMIGCA